MPSQGVETKRQRKTATFTLRDEARGLLRDLAEAYNTPQSRVVEQLILTYGKKALELHRKQGVRI